MVEEAVHGERQEWESEGNDGAVGDEFLRLLSVFGRSIPSPYRIHSQPI